MLLTIGANNHSHLLFALGIGFIFAHVTGIHLLKPKGLFLVTSRVFRFLFASLWKLVTVFISKTKIKTETENMYAANLLSTYVKRKHV